MSVRSFAPDRLAFLLLAMLAGAMLAVPWTWFAYRRSHVEWQGVDVMHHALIIKQLSVPEGRNEHALGELAHYPVGSHWLAVVAMPLFGDDPFLAMRYVAAVTMWILLLAPYVLLCRAMGPLSALLCLLLWQFACLALKVAGFNHFMWEGQYNYSRGVGTAAYWMMLVLLTGNHRTQTAQLGSWIAAIVCACFAINCHIAPGAVGLATLVFFSGMVFLRERRPHSLMLGVLTCLGFGISLLISREWLTMPTLANRDGWLPVGPQWILMLWAPTLVVVLVRWGAFGYPLNVMEQSLTAGLLAAGALQGYLIFKMLVLGTCAPYAVKSVYALTFGLASLLWCCWSVRWARQWNVSASLAARWKVAGPVLAFMLIAALGYRFTKMDLGLRWRIPDALAGRVLPPAETLPHQTTRTISGLGEHKGDYLYVDPLQPVGSLYVSMTALDVAWSTIERCEKKMKKNGIDGVLSAGLMKGLIVPRSADLSRVTSLPMDIEDLGPFRKCRLRTTEPAPSPTGVPVTQTAP